VATVPIVSISTFPVASKNPALVPDMSSCVLVTAVNGEDGIVNGAVYIDVPLVTLISDKYPWNGLEGKLTFCVTCPILTGTDGWSSSVKDAVCVID